MRLFIAIMLFAFPAYAAPVCEPGEYEEFELDALDEFADEIATGKEKVCLVARIENVGSGKEVGSEKRDVGSFLHHTGDRFSHGIYVDITDLPTKQRRHVTMECEDFNTEANCAAAWYGTVMAYPQWRGKWLFKPDKVVP